jgi:hypothetical protein
MLGLLERVRGAASLAVKGPIPILMASSRASLSILGATQELPDHPRQDGLWVRILPERFSWVLQSRVGKPDGIGGPLADP